MCFAEGEDTGKGRSTRTAREGGALSVGLGFHVLYILVSLLWLGCAGRSKRKREGVGKKGAVRMHRYHQLIHIWELCFFCCFKFFSIFFLILAYADCFQKMMVLLFCDSIPKIIHFCIFCGISSKENRDVVVDFLQK